jgi:hypothetical protein
MKAEKKSSRFVGSVDRHTFSRMRSSIGVLDAEAILVAVVEKRRRGMTWPRVMGRSIYSLCNKSLRV